MLNAFTLYASALVVVAMPVAATAAPAANPASSLSLAPTVRTGTSATNKSRLGGNNQIIPLLIGAGVIAAAAYLIIDKENDDDNAASR